MADIGLRTDLQSQYLHILVTSFIETRLAISYQLVRLKLPFECTDLIACAKT